MDANRKLKLNAKSPGLRREQKVQVSDTTMLKRDIQLVTKEPNLNSSKEQE